MGDLMYIGSCSGNFYALDRETGSPVWSYDASADGGRPNFHGNARFVDDLVVVGTDAGGRGFLYAFERKTGRLRWRQEAPGGFPSDVLVRGDRAHAVTMEGEVRCLDWRDGKTAWSVKGQEGERFLRSGIVAAGDTLYVGLPSGTVMALDADSGERRWRTALPARLNTPPLAVGDALYVGSLEGSVLRLARSDGGVLDEYEVGSPVYGSLSSAGGCLLALSAGNTLSCLDPEDGTTLWSRVAETTWSSFRPLVLGDVVLAGEESGAIHALRLSDGKTEWTRNVEGEIKGLGAEDGTLYVGTSQGRVYALPLETP